MRRIALITLAAATVLGGAAAPTQAAETVTVTFSKTTGAWLPGALVGCAVEVAPGVDGIAVLDAAVAKGCLGSYKTTSYSFGTFVDCLDDVCSSDDAAAYYYWAMSENGVPTSYGVDGFSADEADDLNFAYSLFPKV